MILSSNNNKSFSFLQQNTNKKQFFGPKFTPIEWSGDVKMQFFTENLKAEYLTRHLEINGHAILIRNSPSSEKPSMMFDIREVMMMEAMRGLPSNNIDFQSKMLGLISRYHKNLMTGDPNGSTWFFEFEDQKSKSDCFFAYNCNLLWAKRFSAFFYPRFGAEVTYNNKYEFSYDSSKETYIRLHRINLKSFKEGALEDRGSKLDSKSKKKWLVINSRSLYFYNKKDAEELSSIFLGDSDIALICNDVIKKKGKYINWFVIFNKDKTCILECPNTQELEVWCRTILQLTTTNKVIFFFY